MDKCVMTNSDVERLFEWRDRHIELTRRCPCPLKGIEIILTDAKCRLKCVRDDDILTIIYSVGDFKCKYVLKVLPSLYYRLIKTTCKDFDERILQDVAGLYFALMALMTYGDDVEYTPKELDVLDEVVTRKLNKKQGVHTRKKSSQPSITYLLSRGAGDSISVKAKGHHASPRGEFSVRGHFRRYKNGNVVWIDEYRKGTGKRKDKVYKI